MDKSLMCYHTAAVLTMVQREPGIRRSRLYASEQDMRRVDALVDGGYLWRHGDGYAISVAGERARSALEATMKALGVSEYLQEEIRRLEGRYSRRLV